MSQVDFHLSHCWSVRFRFSVGALAFCALVLVVCRMSWDCMWKVSIARASAERSAGVRYLPPSFSPSPSLQSPCIGQPSQADFIIASVIFTHGRGLIVAFGLWPLFPVVALGLHGCTLQSYFTVVLYGRTLQSYLTVILYGRTLRSYFTVVLHGRAPRLAWRRMTQL